MIKQKEQENLLFFVLFDNNYLQILIIPRFYPWDRHQDHRRRADDVADNRICHLVSWEV